MIQATVQAGPVIAMDQAPSLAPWLQLSSRIARVIKCRPKLAAQLLCAPRNAFHATAVYLLHHPCEDDEEVGGALSRLSPKELVSRCLTPASGFLAALKRCGPVVEPLNFYVSLNDLLLSPMGNELSLEKVISNDLVTFFQQTQHLDPLVRVAPDALGLNLNNAQKFHEMIGFCRRLNILRADEEEARLLRFSAKHGIGRYITKRLERCISPWHLDLPSPLHHVKTAKELMGLAKRYRNCLGRVCYKAQLGLGSHVYVTVERPFDCIVELEHGLGNTWSIIECEHTSTRKASSQMREQIAALMNGAGLDVRPHAFSELWRDIERLRSRREAVPVENLPFIEDLWDATWADQRRG